MFGDDFIQRALTAGPAILFALTIHEYSHAWAALRFGDSTARDMGRLTLNPMAHLDLWGTLMMVMSQFRFGWAKPVPVNHANLRGNPRVADFWISLAGPASNMTLAFVFGMMFRAFDGTGILPEPIYMILFYCVFINIALAFFNLIPLFPLDGSHILRSVVSESYGPTLDSLDRVSPFILLALVIMGGIWIVLGPIVGFFLWLLAGV